ncbi:uncharacterized protein LOC141630996 [Silene latifolia]|uniref:uncharacterized protein LOC141630996 n=1 Tax=Silene latifolia TaxID=37657 RepID=UPI003D78853B
MVFLYETKLSGAKFEMYYGMHVDSVGRAGRLAFWWHKDIKYEFLSASVHHMDFIVREANGDWRVMGFYGWPMFADRHLSWELLRVLGQQSVLPWMCIGDYNEILFANEMKGGQRAQWQINQFREAVDACGLVDVSFEGYAFTWDNGLCHLGREWSDHSPLKLVLDRRKSVVQTSKRFRFEQIWVGSEGCEEVILHGFERGGDLMEALQESATELQAWKWVSIGKIVKMIATKRSQIARLNERGRTAEEVQCRRKLRKAKNHISKLVDDGGVVRCGDEAVSRVPTSYFTELFTAAPARDFEDVFAGMEGRVTAEMNSELGREYSEEEVVEALNQMHPLKAPGPDGMNCLFYQTYWHCWTVGDGYSPAGLKWGTDARWGKPYSYCPYPKEEGAG